MYAGTEECTITHNKFYFGNIEVSSGSSHNEISCNLIDNSLNSSSISEIGISLWCSDYMIIKNNTLYDCGLDLTASFRSDLPEYGLLSTYVVECNMINDRLLGFYYGLNRYNFENSDYGQLIFVDCTHINVRNQVMSSVPFGIAFFGCDDIKVEDNLFNDMLTESYWNCNSGIYAKNCSNVIIENNTAYNVFKGIVLSYTTDGIIKDNYVNNVSKEGINVEHCYKITISDNICTNNDKGIVVQFGLATQEGGHNDFITIENNICSSNIDGIGIMGTSQSVIRLNLLELNEGTGLVMWFESRWAVIYLNAFIDNIDNNHAADMGLGNTWYNELLEVGNYWSNWISGPYYISEDSVDLYPLYEIHL